MRIKQLYCLLLTGCLCCMAWAQPKVPREFQFAAIGGANLSSYTLSPSVTQNKSVGPMFGVGMRYIEEKYFGLQCELLFAQRGIKDRYDAYPQFNFERKFSYIELPMMAHVYFNIGKRNEVALDLGAKVAYNIGESMTANLGDRFDTIAIRAAHGYGHHDLAVKQKLDYGIQAGFGYEFKVNTQMSVQVQGRYYFGLGDIFPNTKGDTFETSSNQSIQLVMALWWHHRIKGKR